MRTRASGWLYGAVLGIVLALTLAGGATSHAARWPDQVLRGITIESRQQSAATIEAVKALRTKPTLRLVTHLEETPENWRELVMGLDPHAQIMMTILDSTQMKLLSAAQISDRTQAFVNAFRDQVDIWEIGNELNGEWVGSGPAEINAKVVAAARVVEAAGERTAITLNYWSSPNCYSQGWEEPRSYVKTIPGEVMEKLDLLMLSVYETACRPIQQPSAQDLATMLADLGAAAPQVMLGIGEIGAQGEEDKDDDNDFSDPTLAEKQRIAQRYMSMQPELSRRLGTRFVGGWFWWYFVRDAVPHTSAGSLWPTLDRLLASL